MDLAILFLAVANFESTRNNFTTCKMEEVLLYKKLDLSIRIHGVIIIPFGLPAIR
jgi:hypothetical protein